VGSKPPSPSTLIGVTALSNPGFLVEVEIVAAVEDEATPSN
jgi:enamine deaminase RidA (YjgF/YER057c/UK114 family)